MANNDKGKKPGVKQEVFAVAGVFCGVFLFLSVFSYAPGATNWCGTVGSVIARTLLGFLGWGAYFLIGLIFFFSSLFLRPNMTFNRLPQLTAALTGTVLSLCALLALLFSDGRQDVAAGGFLGRTVSLLLVSVVGTAGSFLILFLLLVISLMISSYFSPYGLTTSVWIFVKKIFVQLRARFAKQDRRQSRTNHRGKGPAIQKTEKTVAVRELVASAIPVVKKKQQTSAENNKNDEFLLKPVVRGDWKLPSLSLLNRNEQEQKPIAKDVYYAIAKQLEQKLKNFGVSGKVVGISPGPVVTTYEYAPAPGIKISKIVGLADDLALGLRVPSVRVVGSVPGKAALGIEIPNSEREIVFIRDILNSKDYQQNSKKLTLALGLNVVGNPVTANLAKMPHLLIAGATGAGKSVAINTIIGSILFNATPEEVRFLMVDPKRIELSGYEGIPHLLHPVVVEAKLANRALQWAVREMERRYMLLEEQKVKNFDSYNTSVEEKEKLPYIVIIIDELADLMMVASKDVEASIARLAQMARAAGMHLILATQRPSVDVLTGLIKANFPTRISFKVSSKIDSRTIIDTSGAEHLLGNGDMLYLAPGTSTLDRIHGAYISEKETEKLVEFLKNQGKANYDTAVIEQMEKDASEEGPGQDDNMDERYDEAVAVVCESGQASISMVQRRLRVGYNRAARMIEQMEKEGVVGPADGARPREVLARRSYEP